MNNVFDRLFINEARESFEVNDDEVTYDPLHSLTGNFGLGRTWNAGARLMFTEPKPTVKTVEVPIPAEPIDLDMDDDGVIDAADDCPETPGTVKGCPDSDGDGVIDSEDDCVDTPGTDNGCPVEPVTSQEK